MSLSLTYFKHHLKLVPCRETGRNPISVPYTKNRGNSAANYRPISLTCVASKIMESIPRDKKECRAKSPTH